MSEMAKQVYERMFRLAPGSKRLFGSDLLSIARAFGGMLGVLVSAINKPLEFQHIVKGLGTRHQIYGVKPDHFRIHYTSLMKTFTKLLGKADFTEEHKVAWGCLYDWVSDSIKKAMVSSTSGYSGSILLMLGNSKFKQFHATLTNFRFCVSKKKSDQQPKIEIELGEIDDVYEAMEDLGNPKKFKELCFIIETKDGTKLHFACSSEEEKNKWLNQVDWRVVGTSHTAAKIFKKDSASPAANDKRAFKRWKKRNKFLVVY